MRDEHVKAPVSAGNEEANERGRQLLKLSPKERAAEEKRLREPAASGPSPSQEE